MERSDDGDGHRTKVSRLIDDYDLDGFGDELERLWTATGDERKSLRELAEMCNKRILTAAIARSEYDPVGGEVDGVYRQILGEDGTAADRTRTRRQLERNGVDVDALESDFVTYQAIRSYLKRERNAEYEPDTDPIERDRNSIQQLRSRTTAVTESKLDGLDAANEIELGAYQVTVDINVYCEDCGRQYDVTEILDRGACNCPE